MNTQIPTVNDADTNALDNMAVLDVVLRAFAAVGDTLRFRAMVS